jgi:hypothetical protein
LLSWLIPHSFSKIRFSPHLDFVGYWDEGEGNRGEEERENRGEEGGESEGVRQGKELALVSGGVFASGLVGAGGIL